MTKLAKELPPLNNDTQEHIRLAEARAGMPWRKWGPYLSERQWGTVREDYSPDGAAWEFFPHDHARSRAYRWGEDGIAGISDDKQRLCFALAFWNGRDPILKERLFGLTNSEGNHGEDVKEYYFYLDSTPTHSYMKMLYKYPQAAYPYSDIVTTNKSRGPKEPEYELLDTGIFDDNRYFDIFVEYAKASPEDMLIQIRIINRGAAAAELHVLPHLWFRNTWWMNPEAEKPSLSSEASTKETAVCRARDPELGERFLYCEGADELLFTENETNTERLFQTPNATPYVKDAIDRYIVHGERRAVNPEQTGTKAAAHYTVTVAPGAERILRLRLSDRSPASMGRSFRTDFVPVFDQRRRDADAFYAAITPPSLSKDAAAIMRQGFSGMLWNKQTYVFEVAQWLKDRGSKAQSVLASNTRNSEWSHMVVQDVISMPDKWEYPWFAAWDLAFHTVILAGIDPDFAVQQLELMLQQPYLHPNGQIPAYEWNFSDVNPPVHAWATLFNYRYHKDHMGKEALPMLRRSFYKLLLNFSWWVNRKDRNGQNVFEGGFLGLDNIGVFDRSKPLPTGGHLEQADGTAWMALFSQNMLEIALELAASDSIYDGLVVKFYDHFTRIAAAMDRPGAAPSETMWDEEDGFFYDVLRRPDGSAERLKVRSMTGLLPLCAVTVYSEEMLKRMPDYAARLQKFAERHPELIGGISAMSRTGIHGRRMLSVMDETKLRRVLAHLLDPEEFLSDYGIRSISRYHEKHPYVFWVGNEEYRVEYLPGESDSGLFGGNSNWRGPIWMPVNVLIIRALLQLYTFYGDGFTVECPTGSGRKMTLFEVAQDLVARLTAIFLHAGDGRRAVFGNEKKFQNDPHWRDHLLFYEYFHGDTGAGLGASHQTGWTGLISGLLLLFSRLRAEDLRESGVASVFRTDTAAETTPH